MSAGNATMGNRFYRDRDRAMLGGVCAGLARHLGFNLCFTRFLAVIAFLMAAPIAVVAYLAAVFLIPSSSSDYEHTRKRRFSCHRRDWRDGVSSDGAYENEPGPAERQSIAAETVRQRCTELDARVVELEKTITSRRFQLDQELAKLKNS